MRRLVLGLVGAAVLGGGCGYSDDPLVAKVGALRITQSEFRRKLSEISAGYQDYALTPNGRRQFLDVLIREKLIIAVAGRSEAARSPEFQAEWGKLKAEEAERLREGREYLMTRLWVDDLRAKGVLKSSEPEVQEYFKKFPLEVTVRHVQLATPEEAWEVSKKVRAGANFGLIAKAHSLDSATAANGGLMPSAIYGEIVPDLEDVVFRMRVGEISGPIKSKFGYHVLRKDVEKPLAYDEAKPRIEALLEKQKLDGYLQSVQDKFPVEVVDDQFK